MGKINDLYTTINFWIKERDKYHLKYWEYRNKWDSLKNAKEQKAKEN